MSRHKLFAAVAAALAMAASAPSYAITVTLNNNVHDLMNALVAPGSGLNVISATLSGHYDDAKLIGSTGTYTNASGTYGIGNGIVLSTGNVLDYGDGENTQGDRTYGYGIPATAAQEALLDPITGGTYSHFDVTQLDITFTTSTGEVYFYVVFGSEEYPEYVGSPFNDGFGMFLNGVNIAKVGGRPVNISHPDVRPIPGTQLDGVLAPNDNPLLLFGATGLDTNAVHTLTFILADTSDDILDTTVYISGLRGQNPVIPEPTTLWLMASGLATLALRRKRAA